RALLLRPRRRRATVARDPTRRRAEPHVLLLAHVRGRRAPRADLRVSRRWAVRARARDAVRRDQAPPRPLRSERGGAADVRSRGAPGEGRLRRYGHETRALRSVGLRLGRRLPPAPTPRADD